MVYGDAGALSAVASWPSAMSQNSSEPSRFSGRVASLNGASKPNGAYWRRTRSRARLISSITWSSRQKTCESSWVSCRTRNMPASAPVRSLRKSHGVVGEAHRQLAVGAQRRVL